MPATRAAPRLTITALPALVLRTELRWRPWRSGARATGGGPV